MPMPVSLHARSSIQSRPSSTARVASRRATVAVLGELAGVAEQVEEDLAHLGHVGAHVAELRRRSARRSALPFFSTSGWIVVVDVVDQLGDVEGLEEQLHLAGLDLRQVEDVVDQRQQVLAGRVDLLEVGDRTSCCSRSRACSCSISL